MSNDACTALGRHQVSASLNLPSQETREANKARRVPIDPMERVFSAPKKAVPKPSGNVCYVTQSVSEVQAIRNATRNLDNAVLGTPEEQFKRTEDAKKRQKHERKAMKASGMLVDEPIPHDRPSLPKKDSIFVSGPLAAKDAPKIAIAKVQEPSLLGFQSLEHGKELSRVLILPEYVTAKGETKQVSILPEIRQMAADRGDALVSVKCNIGAFLVTYTPFKDGEQNFARIEIKHFMNEGSAHKAGEKAMYEPKERSLDKHEDRPAQYAKDDSVPVEAAIRYTVGKVLWRGEILASEASTRRDENVRDTTARVKPPNYNRQTDWRKQPGGGRPAAMANAAYYIAKGG